MSIFRIGALTILFILLVVTSNQSASATVPNAPEQFSCTSVTEIPRIECEALIALYNGTDGPNWDDNTNWLVTNTPCSWYGVRCNGSHVDRLILRGEYNKPFGLKGTLPSEIGNFNNLTWLELPYNQLSSIPAEIGNLNNLTLLSLSYNQLSNLPAEIGNLNNLTSLSLSVNQLSSIPSTVGNLSNLNTLYLGNNQLSRLPAEIWSINNLHSLSLAQNQFSSIPSTIGNLSNLTWLSLASNQLSHLPAEIWSINNLTWLSLSGNQLGSVPSTIGNLSNLTSLALSRNQLSSLPAEIGNLNNLRALYLQYNYLSSVPAEIGNLSNLTKLILSYNYYLSSLPEEIGELLNLNHLHLRTNQLATLPISIVNLTGARDLTLEYNCLRITDSALLQWVNERDPDWTSTQSLDSSRCESSQPSTDLIADKIEVTQGIQDLNNSVRLVKDKRTYVRFHVHSSDGSHSTTAKLTAQRGSNQVELTPVNSGGQITVRTSPNRGTLDHAFLFELPAGYRQGNVTLTGVVNPDAALAESNDANNSISVNVNFEPVPDQNLVISAMGYGNNVYPSDFHQQKLESWMEKAYPVSGYNTSYRDYYFSTGTPSGFGCRDINPYLQTKRNMDFANGSATEGTRYYGMVADDGGFMRGCAWIGGNVGSGPTGPVPSLWNWDTDGSYGDWYGGHEVNHNYGRRHALFCGAPDPTNPTYPHPNGRISPVLTGNNAIYGFDLDTREIYGPDWSDVMTYCDNQWISDFTYEALMDYFQNTPVMAASATANRVDRLLVIGTIEPHTNDVQLEPLSIIRDAVELRPRVPNGYAIVLRDSAGDELARYGFTPDIIEFGPGLGNEGHDALLGINELVPYVDGTVRVDIEKLGQIIKTVQAGSVTPSVTLDAASGSDGLIIDGDTIYLSWSGNDSDGDTISYLVQYSADNGKTWEVMTPYTTDTSARIHASNIENIKTALFRVVATDGINTTTSDISSTAQYFSSSTGGKAGNVRFADEDILAFDPDSKTWSMYFDGSDVGLRNRDVDAFHILEDGNILLSLDRPRTIAGVAYDDSDIIKFTATSLGNRTRGAFSRYLDGSDVQLTKGGEDIDAIALLANGDLVISTLGTARVTGAVARDEDMLRFHPTRLGNRTEGTWSLYLDGSDVKLSHKNEDIWAAWVDDTIQQVHLSTFKNYNAGGLKGDSDDILACDGAVGNNTRCKLSLEWNGDAHGFGSELIDGYSVGPAPVLAVFSAATDDEDADDDAPEADDESEDVLDDDEYTEHLYLPFISH